MALTCGPENILAVEDFRFSYSQGPIRRKNEGIRLDAISFTVGAGECVALMGKSGIGKTTLLRIISGLVASEPKRGHNGIVRIRNEIMTDVTARVHVPPHLRNVGLAFQKGAGLQEQRTVAENIEYPFRVRGQVLTDDVKQQLAETFALWPAEDDADVEQAMHRFWRARLDHLSGGQRQRVALARCFARPDRALYLLDEPLDGQDNPLRQKLIVKLRDLFATRREAGFIIVTHRMAEAFSLAHRIVYFDADPVGVVRIVAEGPPADLYDRPQHISIARFLGDPAMNIVAADGLRGGRIPAHGERIWEALQRNQVLALLRPEQVALDMGPQVCDFVHAGRIIDERRSGADRIMRVAIDGSSHEPFHVVAPRNYETQDGATVTIGWDWDDLHLFDRASGRRS